MEMGTLKIRTSINFIVKSLQLLALLYLAIGLFTLYCSVAGAVEIIEEK